jgi:alkylation response protein AidB-like acyl-CoA dehydrogenase
MHSVSCLWSARLVDDLDLDDAERRDHEARRAALYAEILRDGVVLAQPFSEPEGDAGSGKGLFTTTARPVDGGWLVSGRKHFASLSGHADRYSVVCTEDAGHDRPVTLFLVVDADAEGVAITGTWDPLGMRATVSRTLELTDAFVPTDRQLMPPDAYRQAARRWPYMFFTLTPTYMGIARAAYDFAVAYLRGEVEGGPAEPRRSSPTKQLAMAEIRLRLDQAESLWRRVIAEAGVDPDRERRLRLFSAQWTVMEHANDVCRRAIAVCGGRSIMRTMPLERLYRDSRCGALMLPWTAEICLERLGRDSLFEPGETD